MRFVTCDEAAINRTHGSGVERVLKNATITLGEQIAEALTCRLGDLVD